MSHRVPKLVPTSPVLKVLERLQSEEGCSDVSESAETGDHSSYSVARCVSSVCNGFHWLASLFRRSASEFHCLARG